MKYFVGMALSALAVTGIATADVCDNLTSFAAALESNSPDGLAEPPVMGAEETLCETIAILEEHGLGGHRKGVLAIDCYWDNSESRTYGEDDARDIAYHLHACPVLIFDQLEDYDEGIEYRFDYGKRTRLLLGESGEGVYLNIFRVE